MDEEFGVGVGPSERAQHAGGGGPTPGHRRRMSARRKQDAVLRLPRGEDLELVSRELAVTAAAISNPGRHALERGQLRRPNLRWMPAYTVARGHHAAS